MWRTIRDESTTVTAIRRGIGRLGSAVDGSRVLGVLPTHGQLSSVLDGGSAARRTAVVRNSTVGTYATALERRFAAAATTARVTTVTTPLRSYLAGSFVYEWFTAEPDPDVLVIDLRETASVGPLLDAVDRVVGTLRPGVSSAALVDGGYRIGSALRERPVRVASLALFGVVLGSVFALAASGDPGPRSITALVLLAGIAAVGMRSTATWADVRESRLMRMLAAAFEPPAPPERAVGGNRAKRDDGNADTETDDDSLARSIDENDTQRDRGRGES